jgi:glycosyltransferase involved in cell wall biosynthesis
MPRRGVEPRAALRGEAMAPTSSPLRITFVVPRYGDGIVGGGETFARSIVEQLVTRGHQLEVLTTTCLSYKSWRDELPPGEEIIGGARVRRFPSSVPRLIPLDEVLKGATTWMRKGAEGLARLRGYDGWSAPRKALQSVLDRAWIYAQGPIVPGVLDALRQDRSDAIFFCGYLYYPTIFGLPLVADRSALIPLSHEEVMMYAPIVRETFRRPKALLLNVPEEAERIRAIASPSCPPQAVVALGMDPPPPPAPYRRPTDKPFILVLGRAGKTKPLAAVWRALKERDGLGTIELDDGRRVPASELTLVTAGEVADHFEGLADVIQLGRVDDATRWGLVRDCLAMVTPSLFESLSLVMLEAWQVRRMVVVNRLCDATDGHVQRCRGGASIDFEAAAVGAEQLLSAVRSRAERDACAARGEAYVAKQYGWDSVVDAYETITRTIVQRGDVGAALTAWGERSGAWARGATT